MKNKTSLKWIMKNSKGQRFGLAMVILMNVLFSATSVLFAFAIKYIIDGATCVNADQGKRMLIGGGIAIGVLVLLQFVLRVAINGLTERVRAKLDIVFRNNAFNGILKKDYKKLSGYHSGELMNRMTGDVGVITDGLTSILPTVCSAVARLLFAVVALIILDPIFAVAFVVAGLIVFGIISVLRSKLKNLHKKSQETEGKTRSFMQEIIENVLAVKVFSVNDKIDKEATRLQDENFKVKMKRKNYAVLGHAAYNFIFSAGYVFALVFGAVKILNGLLSYGDLSAILQLVNNVQVPFASLSGVMPKYYAMLASAERLIEIEEIEEEVLDNECEIDFSNIKAISIKDLNFSYGREKIFESANLKVNKGEILTIKGSSGIGKSTLIKLMLGVYAIDGGEMAFEMQNGDKKAISSATRKAFSYVPQGNMIFSGTIDYNVRFACESATEEQVDKALEIAEATQFISQLPNGKQTMVGENGYGLSEGQVQRLAIARAVLTKAPVLLLDEATSALDEETEKKVLANLKNLKDKTVILISHKKSAFDVCDKLVEIKGKIIKESVKA